MRYAFINGIILDGTKEMQPITGKAVLVDGERIVGIASDLAAIMGYEVIDLGGAISAAGNDQSARPYSGKWRAEE